MVNIRIIVSSSPANKGDLDWGVPELSHNYLPLDILSLFFRESFSSCELRTVPEAVQSETVLVC